MTPEFTGSSTPTGEVDADQVRGAVASFNAKMVEKYGENDQEIPESNSSPRYSSIFEGGRGQRGGGDKFIPQIPTSVLDNYLNSKYGVYSKHTTLHFNEAQSSSAATGLMTGGGGGFPTMNIPVVATMPMAGMMPVQHAQPGQQSGQPLGQSLGQSLGQQAQPAQLAGTASNTQPQTGGSGNGTNEPNAQGVKTFSIKL
jgi:hypothetical protein